MKSLVTVLDVLGAGALLAAGLALVVAVGELKVVPEYEALQLFTSAFITSVVAFASARACQIGHLMHTNVDPRRARASRATEVAALQQVDTTPPVPNPFQRAA